MHNYDAQDEKEGPDGITSRGTNAVGMARRQSTCTTASREGSQKGEGNSAFITGMRPRNS